MGKFKFSLDESTILSLIDQSVNGEFIWSQHSNEFENALKELMWKGIIERKKDSSAIYGNVFVLTSFGQRFIKKSKATHV